MSWIPLEVSLRQFWGARLWELGGSPTPEGMTTAGVQVYPPGIQWGLSTQAGQNSNVPSE